ncbi:nicastrin-like [Primulina tabacum]|uniref:nicastrin-like n=1 Tax=Primulina tabacum TaxID=48773 RepID=UPI003F5996E7
MHGSGIMWKAFNFHVVLLSETSTPILQKAVSTNDKRRASYTEDVVEFDLVMDVCPCIFNPIEIRIRWLDIATLQLFRYHEHGGSSLD